MSLFVADPDWGWWILLYFYLGGLAAGSYFLATLMQLFGRAEEEPLARVGHWLAFPLISVCGLLLIVDLHRPERFWHMLLQSEAVDEAFATGWPLTGEGWSAMLQAPIWKPWSPMSVGAWAILLFSFFSGLSFLANVWPKGGLAWLLRRTWFGHVYHVLGAAVGFFVASYTGVLLSATNQPVWSQSDWVGALFLTSAASTANALIYLIARSRSAVTADSLKRLAHADIWALLLELGVFLAFLASIQPAPDWGAFTGSPALALLLTALLGGVLAPLLLHLVPGGPWRLPAAAVLALGGGLLLRNSVLQSAPAVLAARPPVSADGADPFGVATFQLASLTLLLVILVGVTGLVLWRLGHSRPLRLWLGTGSLVVGGLVFWTYLAALDKVPGIGAVLPANTSPEVGRPRGGGPGASILRDPTALPPRAQHSAEDRP